MLTGIGAHLCLLVLVPTYAYLYWCPPMLTCICAHLCDDVDAIVHSLTDHGLIVQQQALDFL